MNPYEVLGIPENASQEEIKKAYRREAMKWHPDRSSNSAQTRERFHRAAEAYKFLTENFSTGGTADSAKESYREYDYENSASGQSDNYSGSHYSRHQAKDKFADSVFWEVMLDFAIKLAQTGLGEQKISDKLRLSGCPERLAAVIADKAFNIHAHYASSPGQKRKHGTDNTSFKEERLEAELHKAFLGRRNFLLSPRDTIEYYLVVFSEFRQTRGANLFYMVNPNKRLMRILNFSILFFAVIIVAIDFYPGESEYKLVSDVTLLQIPLGILSLMFIWTAYRKLWLVTVCFWFVYLVALANFNTNIPQALSDNYLSILPIAIICYAPFVFIALFGNYFYYRKAQKVIRAGSLLFVDHQDKIVWVRNIAGTSSSAAFLFAFIFVLSLVYLEPESGEFLDSIDFNLPGVGIIKNDSAGTKARLKLKLAEQFFEIAESHFNSSPPNYVKAFIAYDDAAINGSLLAAYKLGYMHYVGEGVEQSGLLALEYFKQATRAPLAFQPHSLQLTTEYLAESYNNLGIMYQSGYGTKRNVKTAREMYRKAVEFGSKNAARNLKTTHTQSASSARRPLVRPIYQ